MTKPSPRWIAPAYSILAIVLAFQTLGAERADARRSRGEADDSRPTSAGKWNLESDFAKVFQQFDSLEKILTDEEYYAQRHEKTSKWSAGLQAGHTALVLYTIAVQIELNLKNPGRDADGEFMPMVNMILRGGTIPRGVGKAPALVMPLKDDREHWLRLIGRAREKWTGLHARIDEIPDCPARFKHFMFGYLTSSDWVRFMAVHSAHHLKIVRDILKETGGDERFGREL